MRLRAAVAGRVGRAASLEPLAAKIEHAVPTDRGGFKQAGRESCHVRRKSGVCPYATGELVVIYGKPHPAEGFPSTTAHDLGIETQAVNVRQPLDHYSPVFT